MLTVVLHNSLAISFYSIFFVSLASSSRVPKHQWTKEEESTLIECLVQLVSTGGWRSDNETFTSSYLAQLVKMMAKKAAKMQCYWLSDKVFEEDIPENSRNAEPNMQWVQMERGFEVYNCLEGRIWQLGQGRK